MNDKTTSRPTFATKYRRLLTLRTKMLLAFGTLFILTGSATVLVGLYGLPFTDFGGEYRRQKEQVLHHLNFVADRKKDRLEQLITERKTDASVMAKNGQLSTDLTALRALLKKQLIGDLADPQVRAELQRLDVYRSLYSQLSVIQSAYNGYESVSIADWPTFSVIVSTDPDELGRRHPNPRPSDSQLIINSGEALIGEISITDSIYQPSLHIAAPIWANTDIDTQAEEVIGLLIVQMSLGEVVKPILSGGDGLGVTGEALLVDRYCRILTPLKHPLADGSEAVPLKYRIDSEPATLAALGKEGLIASNDYRGESVLAAYRHIRISPEFGWGMVVKMDESEIYATLQKILKYSYTAGGAVAFLVLSLIVIISRHLSRPIDDLSLVAREVEAGNLLARVDHSANDEIGLLGRAFNSMIEQINCWHNELEDKVEARTLELKTIIKELAREVGRRKLAQEALKESESLYHSLVDTSQDLIWKCDNQGRFIFLNKPWEKTHGYSLDEMLGRPFQDFQTQEQARRDAEEFGRHLAGGSVAGYETTHISKSGDTIYLVFNAVPLFDKAGNIVGTQGTAYDITERKLAEEALRDSEMVYRRTIENASGVPYQLDLVSNEYVFIGGGIEDLVGVAPETFTPATYGEMLVDQVVIDPRGPEDYVAYGDDFRRGVVGQYRSDVRIQTPNGDVKWVSDSAVPIRDDSGQVVGSLGILMDVTERKLAELTLKESEERYRSIFDTAANLITSVNRQGILVDCNRQIEKVLGYSKDEVVGQSFAKIIHPDGLAHAQRDLQEILTKGYLFHHEHRMVCKDGRVIDVIMNSSGLRGADGEYERTICIIDDITDRKLAATVLENSVSLLEATLESTADGILVVNHEGKVIRYNQRFLELWTIPKAVADTHDDKKLLGHVLAQLKEPTKFIDKVKELYADPEASSIDVLEFRDGRVFERFSLPQKIGNKIVGRVWSFRDITETKRLQKLEARAQRLETAGQIAGQVAHDFNNLLAPMLAYPEFIREELCQDHPALPFLSDIEKGARQIAEINQQLLTLGRRGHYNQEPLNLNSIVNDAVKEITPLPEKLSCETFLCPDIMNVMGGPAQLQRVLSNLISNARHAMKDDGTITITTENYYVDAVSVAYGRVPRGEYVKLTISDTGHGIPDEVAHQIFDPFFTTKTTDKQRGSGLGLSVVDAVIRDHNGYIDLNTKLNEGTSFYLYFPTTRDTVDHRYTESMEGGTETILVIDDDQVQREVSTKLLQVLGYKTAAVDSGERAIEFLKENPQDLLLLDMIMPGGIDGAETYNRSLKINPSQRAIIVSGYAESDRVDAALEMGAGSFVRKPLTRRVLAAAVRRELDKRPLIKTT